MPSESRFPLRLPTSLYEAVKAEAARRGDSANEYIVYALTQFLMIKEEHDQRISDLEIKVANLMQQEQRTTDAKSD